MRKDASAVWKRNFFITLCAACFCALVLLTSCIQKNGKKGASNSQNDGTPPAPTSTSTDTVPWQPDITLSAALLNTEHFYLMPTYAKVTATGWSGRLNVSVYKSMTNTLERQAVQKALSLALSIPDDATSGDNFQRRTAPFLVDYTQGRDVTLSMHGKYVSRLYTDTDGDIIIDYADPDATQAATQLQQEGSFPVTPTIQVSPGVYDELKGATIEVLRPKGLSVISDIDDTIKITNVGSSTTDLLKNTFLNNFAAVPNMNTLYQHFKNDCKATIHYVSASPEQLAPEFWRFFADSNFPFGPLHLKRVRLKDKSFLQLIGDPGTYKTEILTGLFTEFPERQFILIGDTGEKDPETYADMLSKYSGQVRRIFLRIITPSTALQTRLNNLYNGNAKLTTFQDASALSKTCGV